MPEPNIAPLPSEEITFPITALGTVAHDWLSTSGDKVEDVRLLNDGKYIYYETDLIPEVPIHAIVKFTLNLGGLTISSAPYEAQVIPCEVDFLSSYPPGGGIWTSQQVQDYEPECADNIFLKIDSLRSDTSALPICDIVSAGIRATIQYDVVYNKIQTRVLKLEKLVKYVPA